MWYRASEGGPRHLSFVSRVNNSCCVNLINLADREPYLIAGDWRTRRRYLSLDLSILCVENRRRNEPWGLNLAVDGRRPQLVEAAMKCKKHPYELGAGVCASCLRERLLALVAAEKELSPHRHPWGFDAPTIAFPRSVSPYLPHRRSVGSDASHHHDPSFFSTPGLGHTLDGEFDGGRNRRSGRFSVLKALFGHHTSEKGEADWVPRKSSGPRSWFSALVRLRRRRKKQQPELFSAAEGEAPPEQDTRSCRLVQRGMSPAMEDEEEADASGYTSESSNGWRRPIPTSLRRISASSRHRHRHHQQQQQQQLRGVGGVSGFTVRLSPLMRSGASGRHSQVSESAGVSGELRYPANSVRRDRRPATGCAPLGLDPSRSWKLADFGRFK